MDQMEGNEFIGREIRRTNRNLLLLGLVLLGLVGGALALGWREVRPYVFGPTSVEASELGSLSKMGDAAHSYIEVKGEASFETGFEEKKARHPDQVLSKIVVLLAGNQLLLIKAPSFDPTQLKFKGTVIQLPWEAQNRIVQDWKEKHPKIRPAALPYALDSTGIWKSDSVIAAIFAALFIGLGVYFVLLSASRIIMPDNHPLLTKLAQYGDLGEVQSQIDQEMDREAGGEKFGALRVTSNWLIHAWAFKTRVMANKDIIWGYAKETKHYHNGIPTGTTYTALVRDQKGQEIEVKAKKNSLPKIMESLGRRNPWMVVGYTKELDQLWKKDRPKFLELVEKRRASGAAS